MSESNNPLKVFLCHAHSDRDAVKVLYNHLVHDGVDVWLDKEQLLPGQNWRIEIQKAVRSADVVVVCHSKDFNNVGFRQREVKWALDTAMEKPEGEIFIIPARLEACDVLDSLTDWHWVDLFEENGYEMLMRALQARAKNIGATFQAKRRWMSNISIPRAKTDKADVKYGSGVSTPHHSENTKGADIAGPNLTAAPKTNRSKIKTEYLVAIIGAGAIVAAVISSPSVERWFSQALIPTASSTMTLQVSPTVHSSELVDKQGVQVVMVPEGKFIMGSDTGNANEQPKHQVYLDAYYIDKYEVTNDLYRRCVDAGACDLPAISEQYNDSYYAQYPVVGVDWGMAKAYCEWRGARLPTEAEWEKAARGKAGLLFPWGNSFDTKLSNFCDKNCSFGHADKKASDGYGKTSPVGSYPNGVSPYGVHDMAGNVWEWVSDWYSVTYYSTYPQNQWPLNPTGPENGQRRVLRGGSWFSSNEFLRSTYRYAESPTLARNAVGIRCASEEN